METWINPPQHKAFPAALPTDFTQMWLPFSQPPSAVDEILFCSSSSCLTNAVLAHHPPAHHDTCHNLLLLISIIQTNARRCTLSLPPQTPSWAELMSYTNSGEDGTALCLQVLLWGARAGIYLLFKTTQGAALPGTGHWCWVVSSSYGDGEGIL